MLEDEKSAHHQHDADDDADCDHQLPDTTHSPKDRDSIYAQGMRAVAAGHPATADAGAEILEDGWQRRRRSGRRVPRLVRRRDRHDRISRRRARDLLRRGERAGGEPRLLHRDARAGTSAARGSARSSSKCPSAQSSSTTPSGSARAASRAFRPGSTRSGARTAGCPGRSSSSPRSGLRTEPCRCPRPTRRAWRCSRP